MLSLCRFTLAFYPQSRNPGTKFISNSMTMKMKKHSDRSQVVRKLVLPSYSDSSDDMDSDLDVDLLLDDTSYMFKSDKQKSNQSKQVDSESLSQTCTTTDSDAEPTTRSKSSNHKHFHCYLLRSLDPKHPNKTYIGYTVHPDRRLRQHNGDLKGNGARKTKRAGRPWEFVLIIHGFPDAKTALQFEWAWQHPGKSLAVRTNCESDENARKLGRRYNLAGKFDILAVLLCQAEQYQSLPLSLFFQHEDFQQIFVKSLNKHGALELPPQMRQELKQIEEMPFWSDLQKSKKRVKPKLSDQEVWQTNFKLLCDNKSELKSYSLESEPDLHSWISEQRRQYILFLKGQESSLDHDRVAALESLGPDWEAFATTKEDLSHKQNSDNTDYSVNKSCEDEEEIKKEKQVDADHFVDDHSLDDHCLWINDHDSISNSGSASILVEPNAPLCQSDQLMNETSVSSGTPNRISSMNDDCMLDISGILKSRATPQDVLKFAPMLTPELNYGSHATQDEFDSEYDDFQSLVSYPKIFESDSSKVAGSLSPGEHSIVDLCDTPAVAILSNIKLTRNVDVSLIDLCDSD